MKSKILVMLGMFMLAIGAASAAETTVTWNGAGSIYADMQNSESGSSVTGSGNDIQGSFHADDGHYGRVGASVDATFDNSGSYHFSSWNDDGNPASKPGKSYLGAGVSGNSGFMDLSHHSVSRESFSLGTNGYSGHGWPGTDSPAVGAEGTNYNVYVEASYDLDDNGNFFEATDSWYSASVVGNGDAGIGTWKAGSNDVVSAGSKVSGDIMVRGSGSATFTQNFHDTNSIETRNFWN